MDELVPMGLFLLLAAGLLGGDVLVASYGDHCLPDRELKK